MVDVFWSNMHTESHSIPQPNDNLDYICFHLALNFRYTGLDSSKKAYFDIYSHKGSILTLLIAMYLFPVKVDMFWITSLCGLE